MFLKEKPYWQNFLSFGCAWGANHVSERSENIIFEKFGTRRTFFIPLASLSDEKQRVYGRSKKVTFQSDSCLDSGFSQVCGGLFTRNHSINLFAIRILRNLNTFVSPTT